MVTGKLTIMGQIEVKEPDDKTVTHPMALLINFNSVEDIRQAIADGECKFVFGDGDD